MRKVAFRVTRGVASPKAQLGDPSLVAEPPVSVSCVLLCSVPVPILYLLLQEARCPFHLLPSRFRGQAVTVSRWGQAEGPGALGWARGEPVCTAIEEDFVFRAAEQAAG